MFLHHILPSQSFTCTPFAIQQLWADQPAFSVWSRVVHQDCRSSFSSLHLNVEYLFQVLSMLHSSMPPRPWLWVCVLAICAPFFQVWCPRQQSRISPPYPLHIFTSSASTSPWSPCCLNASLSMNMKTASSMVTNLPFVCLRRPLAWTQSIRSRLRAVFDYSLLLSHKSALLIKSANVYLTYMPALRRTLHSSHNSRQLSKNS